MSHDLSRRVFRQPALADEGAPGGKAERQMQKRALSFVQPFAQDFVTGCQRRAEAQLVDLARQCVMLGVAQHAGGEIAVARIPAVQGA